MTICDKNNNRVAQGRAQPDYSVLEPFFDKAFRILRRNYAKPGLDGISIREIKKDYKKHKESLKFHQISEPQKTIITDYYGFPITINKYNILDIWLQLALRLYLEQRTEYQIPDNVFSYRKNNGEIALQDYIKDWNNILSTDISEFGKNVSRTILEEWLLKFVPRDILNLAWYGSDGGLPTGNAMTVFMTNYYLSDIDSMFQSGYARFGDDMFFNLDVYNADDIIHNVGAVLKKLNLSFNNSKMKVIKKD